MNRIQNRVRNMTISNSNSNSELNLPPDRQFDEALPRHPGQRRSIFLLILSSVCGLFVAFLLNFLAQPPFLIAAFIAVLGPLITASWLSCQYVCNEQENRQREKMALLRRQKLREFTHHLTETLEIKDVIDLLIQAVTESVASENVVILLHSGEQGGFMTVASREPLTSPITLPLTDIPANLQNEQSDTVILAAFEACLLPCLNRAGFEEGFPFEQRRNLIGAVGIQCSTKPLTRDDRDFLSHLFEVSALSISNSLSFEKQILAQRMELENSRLQQMDQKKTELIHMVAHELRTPLTAIRSYSQLLQDERDVIPLDKQHRFLQIISGESKRLNTMITQMLDLARINSGRVSMNLVESDLKELIRKAVETIAVQAEVNQIAVLEDLPPDAIRVYMDADKILQVLLNLLSNAVKYTHEGGQVTIGATMLTDSDLSVGTEQETEQEIQGFARVYVQDTGVGMSPEDTTRIFEEFYRINNKISKEAKGTGLGLPICRSIVEAHGGLIWAESQENAGTTLFFILPLRTQAMLKKVRADYG